MRGRAVSVSLVRLPTVTHFANVLSGRSRLRLRRVLSGRSRLRLPRGSPIACGPLFDHPVEAVLLDAGGVLLLPDPTAMRRAVARFGVAPDDDLCARAHYAAN